MLQKIIMEQLRALPPVTKVWLTASMSCTVACYFKWMSPLDFACSWTFVLYTGFGWKGLFLTFLYLGPPSLSLAFNLYFLITQASTYEQRPVDGGGGSSIVDFTWQVLLGIAFLLIGTAFAEAVLFVDSPFLALGLAAYLRALWAFSNPYVPINYFSQTMEAWKLPAASLAFQAVTNGTEGMAEDVIAAAGAYAVVLGLRYRSAERAEGLVSKCLSIVAGTPRWWAVVLHAARIAPEPPRPPRDNRTASTTAAAATTSTTTDGSPLGAFAVGDAVEVVGTSVASLNGELGIVHSVIAASGRLQVQLADAGRVVALRPVNLIHRSLHEHAD